MRGMIKTVSPAGWDFDRPIAIPVRMSSRGLIGNDRHDFLKIASHIFLEALDNIKVADGEEPVHVIGLGASDRWGMNRNGDLFSWPTCLKYAHTFEKFGRWYRAHQNKDPAKSYGRIIKAACNDDMHRVELLVGLNKTAEAAQRNGGLIADRELEKLASGKDLAVSMAGRVPYDVCIACDNKARTREDYCTEQTCKAGGCKENLTRLVKIGNDIIQLGVDNPHITWFDMSDVWRPACRTCFGGRADYLHKAAADDFDGFFGVSSAKTAEDFGITAPWEIMLEQDENSLPANADESLREQLKLAHAMAVLESRVDTIGPAVYKMAFDANVQGQLPVEFMGDVGTRRCTEALVALADSKTIMPFRDFARLCKSAELTSTAQRLLPGVYGRMVDDGNLPQRLSNNRFTVAGKVASDAKNSWAFRQSPAFSLQKSAVDKRCMRASLRGLPMVLISGYKGTKEAGDSTAAEALAQDYACYQLAALQRIAAHDNEFMLTARLAILQNHVV